jgi:DUF4097 and DUF4098 domain-containing protein YvlB
MAVDLRDPRRRFRLTVAVLPLVVALAGCEMSVGNLTGRATDEWTHTYPLTAGGELEITNTNGRIEVEGVDGSTVEVRAERIAKAATDTGARELLPRIVIKETVTPEHVTIATERMSGIMVGAGFEVRYHVRAPRSAILRLTNSNGVVSATGVTGQLIAHTTNGGVNARNVTGEIDARTTNGQVAVDLTSLTSKVTLKTTNGSVVLTMPDDAKADISASCTNGGISISGLKLETTESSRRRVEGKLNGGGVPIELRTTNGAIRVRSRSVEAENSKS